MRTIRHATLLAALCFPPAATAAPPEPGATAPAEAGWVLAQLARPAPTRTGFVEVRGSALLRAPLRIEGEYRRPDAGTLVRVVNAPYAETTTIRAGEAEIARAGKSPRRFPLSRAPELAGLQASFGALLAGDRAGLERHYRVAADGTRAQWTLTLTPTDAALAAKVASIVLRGRADELRCIETTPVARGKAPAEVQRTLLGGAARAAQGVADASALSALCRGTARG